MSQSRKAAKSVFFMIILAFGSKLLGLTREVLIAAKFGSGVETDVFFIAITATTLFTKMLTQSINTTMIPVLSEVETNQGKEGKKRHTNNLLNIVLLISFIVVILAWILAPIIIKILAHGFEGEQFDLTVLLMRIGLPVIFFAGIVGVFRGYLQSELKFAESAATQFPFNLVYIFYLIFLAGIFGIKGLMVSSVLAVGSQILIQMPEIKKIGYRYKCVLELKDKYLKKIVFLVPPVLISVTIHDFNKIIDRSLASTLIDGSISALSYGNRLKALILEIFIAAITTVIFPMLSNEANKQNYDGLKKVMGYGINIILLITIPATVGMIVLAEPIVRIAFERGAFNTTATHMTAGSLIFYSLGLTAMGVRNFLNRVYYALHDTKTPMFNGFVAVAFNIILNVILVKVMAYRGLALATSISATITTGLLLYTLRKKIGHLGTMKLIKCGLKSLLASIVMGGVVYFLHINLEKTMSGSTVINLLVLLISSAVGALIYMIVICLFKVDEMKLLMNLFKIKFAKKRKKI